MTRFLLVLAAALVAAPAALADGVGGYAVQNGDGLLAADGSSRLVAIGLYNEPHTTLAKISTATGSVEYSVPLLGAWGIPTVVPNIPEGRSADGKTLILAQALSTFPRAHSGFLIVAARLLRVRHAFSLPGEFEYDSLSPDGRRLYLIQHTSQT